MRQYTSCFVGVPLPEKFQKKFEDLLEKIRKLYLSWETTHPKTPHITVYYLDRQSQFAIPVIKNIVEKEVSYLRYLNLTVKNFNYFTKEDEREGIIFLDVLYPSALKDFKHRISKTLNEYYVADNNLPFHPHITVARAKSDTDDLALKDSVHKLVSKINEINWEFPITEIAIYGVDSTLNPQHQEKP